MGEVEKLKVFEDALKNYLGPVLEFLQDDSVTEILINGFDQIFIERKGKLHGTDAAFESEDELLAAVNNMGQFVGRKINEDNPRLDARLPNGSRIHAVIPPCSRGGTTVAIRKFSAETVDFKKYIEWGAITPEAAQFLEICMFLGKNILVSGGTGSGKTTLLGLLCARIPRGQRLIVIEDACELTVDYEHVVRFETKQADEQGKGGVSIYDLLKSSLRLRPDRIIVGEVRGAEGLELIQAMNTGHKGCMGTIHANSTADAMLRLEALSMGEENKISEKALKQSLTSAIDMVIQISRLSDGSRKVISIAEVLDMDEKENYVTKDIYSITNMIRQKDGKLKGQIEPTGYVPTFMKEIEDNRIPFPKSKFSNKKKAS